MKQVKDNFSSYSSNYATYRPTQPDELYEFLYSQVEQFDTAWDCGTGNGQIALRLAEKFEQVYATDISAQQLALAPQKDNITYLLERAEATTLADNSVDLVTVAQAVHWFDFDAFNKEVNRVAKPGALIALITYYTPKFDEAVDKLVDELYWDITRTYWDKERQYVDDKYMTIPFPYKEIDVPTMSIQLKWNIDQALGYLRTWSGVQHYIKQHQEDPVAMIEPRMRALWNETEMKEVRFPLFVRMGRIEK